MSEKKKVISVTQKQFISEVADRLDISKRDAEKVVLAFQGTVQKHLREGHRISMPGFGVWKVVERKTRMAKNPMTGETVEVPAKRVPKFLPGSILKDLDSSSGMVF